MKATIIPPPEAEPNIALELTVRDAQILHALVGGVSTLCHEGNLASVTVTSVYIALDEALDTLGRCTSETFSDYFAVDARGQITCR